MLLRELASSVSNIKAFLPDQEQDEDTLTNKGAVTQNAPMSVIPHDPTPRMQAILRN